MQNVDLTLKMWNIIKFKKYKNLKVYIKIEKSVTKFDDIEIEK